MSTDYKNFIHKKIRAFLFPIFVLLPVFPLGFRRSFALCLHFFPIFVTCLVLESLYSAISVRFSEKSTRRQIAA